MAPNDEGISEKLRRAYRESGVAGVGRRVGRVAAQTLGAQFDRWSTDLLLAEAWARLTDWEKELVSANVDLTDRHRGRRAFVIGTGPSLSALDLGLLRDELTFAVNAFCRHPIVSQWQPSYYFVTDGLFFDGSPNSIEFLTDLATRVHASTFFAPVHHHQQVRVTFPPESTRFVAVDGRLGSQREVELRLDRVLPAPPTVLQTALVAAVTMGCSPVYLLGADHSWLATPAVEDTAHFYATKTLHHQADAVLPAQAKYLRTIEYVGNVWHGHLAVDAFARSRGVEICNATQGGFLDVFPRVAFDELF